MTNKAFLYVYFQADVHIKGVEDQNVHFALSRDGLHWTALHQNRAILLADQGTKAIRDPYLFYNRLTKKYTILATDLDANGKDWGRYANAGSLQIAVWESENLLDWSKEQLFPLAKPGTGCMWAPTVCFDEEANDYAVFFTANYPGTFDKCIWCAHTVDFHSYGEPFVFKAPEKNVEGIRDFRKFRRSPNLTFIDATIVPLQGKYYMFVKREQDVTVQLEVADSLFGEYKLVKSKLLNTNGIEGPAVTPIDEPQCDADPFRYILWTDGYCGPNKRKFLFPSEANSVADFAQGNFRRLKPKEFKMPLGGKHGSVISISDDEYEALLARFGGES